MLPSIRPPRKPLALASPAAPPRTAMFPHDKLDWHISRLERRLESAPDDGATRLELSRACISRGWFHDGGEVWFNKALTQARRVLQHDPANAGALVVAGAALVGLERLEPATRYLDEAMRVAPDRADVHLALGALHLTAQERHQAVRELESTCRLAPESWEAHWLLARVLWERAQELGRAGRLVERSQYHTVRALQLGASPSLQPEMVYHLGITCLHTSRFADANKLFASLLESERYRARAQYYLGLVHYQLGKYKNAVLYLRQHLQKAPDNPRVQARLGMCYLQLGEVIKAREACNRALAIDPTDLQARWTLGCALVEEGRDDEATRTFKAILEEAPHHAPAFNELVRMRSTHRDSRWLRQALRAEVTSYDRLPLGGSAPAPDGGPQASPREVTRERIEAILRALDSVDDDGVQAMLEATDLTTEEGLRFRLWEAALDHVAGRRARALANRLQEPGRGFSAEAGREALALAHMLPEPLLVRGLQVGEEDLRRAAVDRHGPAPDVGDHRRKIDHERREARAWQALLLLAVATRGNRSSRPLLVRWATEADADLADAARAALAMLGDEESGSTLRKRARARGAANLVDAMLTQVSPPRARFRPKPVSDDTDRVCSTCGRRAGEVAHLLAGGDAAVCDRCMTDIARDRRVLQADDPDVHCALCDKNTLEARAVFVHRAVAVCSDCLEQSLGLLEREEIDRWMAVL